MTSGRTPTPAVIVDIQSINAIQTAHLLWTRGIPLIGIGSDPRSPFCRSRAYARKVFTSTTDERLIATLEDVGRSLPERAPLFLSADEAVLLVSRHRQRLEPWYHIALPDDAIIQMLVDKIPFARFAEAHGLPIPRTIVVEDAAQAEQAATQLRYPAVLKPGVRAAHWAAHTKAKAFRADSPADLMDIYQRVSGWGGGVLAQEMILGPESSLFSCNAYFAADGSPLATFVARKIRQWPPKAGRSSLGVSCRNDEVLEIALRTFQAAGFRGPAYLELKQDERDGRHWIIEPNVGRSTGRSAIAEAGGVELLMTQYCDLLGLPLPEQRTQGPGEVKWIYLRWDLQASAVGMLKGELSPVAWWRSLRGPKFFAAWHRHDMRPFLLDFWWAIELRARLAFRWLEARLPRRQGKPAAAASGLVRVPAGSAQGQS